jgi:hypothetical protein
MNDSELQLLRNRVAAAAARVRDIEKLLQLHGAGDLIAALGALGTVRAELEALGGGQHATALDQSINEEALQRARSEVDSDEFDMQG